MPPERALSGGVRGGMERTGGLPATVFGFFRKPAMPGEFECEETVFFPCSGTDVVDACQGFAFGGRPARNPKSASGNPWKSVQFVSVRCHGNRLRQP
jgi:hypothetical protein